MKITVSEYKIKTGNRAAGKFIFVSDLHNCDNYPIIDIIERQAPDAVLISGDFIHSSEVYERGFDFIDSASRLCKVFCSVGNHEAKFEGGLKGEVVRRHGVLLDNETALFNGVYIGGLSSGFTYGAEQGELRGTPPPDVNWLRRFSGYKGFKILLSHHPEYYDSYIRSLNIDLTLSGHAHGGQIRLFGNGLFAPGQGVLPKYTSGLYDGRLLVSRGLGNSVFIPRIFNSPEVIIINLY